MHTDAQSGWSGGSDLRDEVISTEDLERGDLSPLSLTREPEGQGA